MKVSEKMNIADQITLRQLRALAEVTEKNNISLAAEAMGLTAPAVHNQLKNLENMIGASVLVRDGRARNTATEQGEILLRAHREITATLGRAQTSLDALDAGHSGSVVLGVVSTAKYFAPKIIAMLRHEMPQINVTLKVGNRAETIQALLKGDYELCIMGRPPRDPDTLSEPLADHPHVMIAAPDHPLATARDIPPQALLSERFMLRETGSGTRIMATRFLDDVGQGQPIETVELTSNETIKQAVLYGLGIALISAHTVAHELQTGRLVALQVRGMPIARKWYLLTPTAFPTTQAALSVREWLMAGPQKYIPDLHLAAAGDD